MDTALESPAPTYTFHRELSPTRRQTNYERTLTATDPNTNIWIPTHVSEDAQHWAANTNTRPFTFHETNPVDDDMSARTWNNRLNQKTTIHRESAVITKIIDDPQQILTIVSDGSVLTSGSYAWIIAHEQQHLAQGIGHTEGDPDQTYSFRAEGYGIFGAIIFLRSLSHRILCRCIFHCDGKSYITSLNQMLMHSSTNPTMTLCSDADLLLATCAIVKRNFRQANFVFVRGHQKERKTATEMTYEEILNEKCDQYAGEISKLQLSSRKYDPSLLPGVISMPYIGSRPITMRLDRQFRQASNSQDYRIYLMRRHSWDNHAIDNVDWHTMAKAINNFHGTELIQIQKFMHGLLATNDVLRQRDSKHAPGCPLCQNSSDSNKHMFYCTHPNMQYITSGILNKINNIHRTSKSCPTINRSLQTYLSNQPSIGNRSNTQAQLGLDSLLQGWWHSSWRQQQSRFFENQQPTMGWSSERWCSESLSAIWQGAIALWRQRCSEIHDTEAGQRDVSAELERRIRALHAEGSLLECVPRQAFSNSIDDILQRPIEGQRNWISIMETMIRSQRRLSKTKQQQQI